MTRGADSPLPAFAGWRHRGAREGFEVAFFGPRHDGVVVEGHTDAIEEGEAFSVGYAIRLDAGWRTRWARVETRTARGVRTVEVEGDGEGRWRVDGRAAPHLDGCLDVDLESSSLTNAFPVRRMALEAGASAEAPAAYVRALGLEVERLEQAYARLDDAGAGPRYDYRAPRFAFHCTVAYDAAGLVLDYPGIAVRAEG